MSEQDVIESLVIELARHRGVPEAVVWYGVRQMLGCPEAQLREERS